ncbi:MAG: CARDB domain-containing protein [Dehalococcoidia bacterium]
MPTYDYRAVYPHLGAVLPVGSTVAPYVTLAAIEHDNESGGVVLHFHATNTSESRDVTPGVTVRGERISATGEFLAERVRFKYTHGWALREAHASGETLPPGQSGDFTLVLPSVVGGPFPLWPFDEMGPPDAMVVQIENRQPAYIPFPRAVTHRDFWLPDLSVANVEWGGFGQEAEISVAVTNRNPWIAAPDSAMIVQVDGETIGTSALASIPGGETIIQQFSWALEKGEHVLSVIIDPEGNLEERDKINNSLSVEFSDETLPDLVVNNLSWEPASPGPGDEVTFTVTVKNQGQGAAKPAAATVFLEHDQIGQIELPGLEADAVASQQFNWPATWKGHRAFRFAVDDNNDIPESDENNNTNSATLFVEVRPGTIITMASGVGFSALTIGPGGVLYAIVPESKVVAIDPDTWNTTVVVNCRSMRIGDCRSWDIAVDSAGSVYFGDTHYDGVHKVDPSSGPVKRIAGGGESTFRSTTRFRATQVDLRNPLAVATGARDELLFSDGRALFTVDSDGWLLPLGTLPEDFDDSADVVVDRFGNIYIASLSRVYMLDPNSGLVTIVAGVGSLGFSGDGGPATEAGLNAPSDRRLYLKIALDGVGNLFIADAGNHRIRRVDARTGVITTVAGTGETGYDGDGGLAINAQLNHPYSLAFDQEGNLLVLEGMDRGRGSPWVYNRIRKIFLGP